jgi:TatD DNase family protein
MVNLFNTANFMRLLPKIMLIDTHCHLDDPSLYNRLPLVLEHARRGGIEKIVVPSVEPANWGRIASLCAHGKGIFPAFGLHPMCAQQYDDNLLSELDLLASDSIAMGEIGLDYMLTEVPREMQIQAFRNQLKLAVRKGLPVLVHCRRAFQDMLAIMREEGASKVGGIMHAFSGSVEIANECITLGFVISIAGPATWQNAVRPVELVKRLSMKNLVLETDAPDMTPEPFRGIPNEPAYLVETAKRVAQIKGIPLDEVAEITSRNAERVLRI